MAKRISPNHREVLYATSSITGEAEYLTSTNHALDTSGGGGGGGNVNLTQVGGSNITLGQNTMANSLPIVIASNQTSIPVAATLTAETTKVIGTVRNADGSGNLLTSTANALDVNIKSGLYNNTISTANSSTTPLGISGAFTGTAEDTTGYGEIRVSLFSDQASATNGVSIQQSSNSTNWDIVDTYTLPASTGKTFVVPRQAQFFRVVYTNGGVAQTTLRLQTIFNRFATTPTSQRAQDAYSNDTDLQQTWSFNSVFNGTTWDRARGDLTGQLVKQRADNSTPTNVNASASSVTLLAANTGRIGGSICNDSTDILYVKFGTTASATSFKVALSGKGSGVGNYYEIPAGYTGRIDGIWSGTNGAARIAEET